MPFSNYHITFDGSNDHVVVGDVEPFKFDIGEPFSISFWFKTTDTGGVPIAKLDGSSPFPGWEVQVLTSVTTGGLLWQIIDDFTVPQRFAINTPKINVDGWFHCVFTKNASQLASGMTVYINGAAVDPPIIFDDTFVSNGGTSFDTTAPLQFGARDGTNAAFAGELDDIAIYDIELSAEEVATIYNGGQPNDLRLNGPSGHLVGYWLMGDGDTFPTLRDRQVSLATTASAGVPDRSQNSNDGTPTNMEDGDFRSVILASETMPDLSGNGNPGTPTNMEDSDFNIDTPGGRHWSWYSMLLDGSDEYIAVGDVPELDFANDEDFSLSAWVKPSGNLSYTICAKREVGAPDAGYEFQIVGGFIRILLEDVDVGRMFITATTTSVNDDDWHHVVATWEGTAGNAASNATLYVDTIEQSVTVGDDTLGDTISNSESFNIGSLDGSIRSLDGYLDDVSVYNKTLSLLEIQEIYNSGIPTDNRGLTTDGYLAGYWGCGDISAGGTTRNVSIFDGTDEEITIGNVAELDFAHNETFSFSFWLKWSVDHIGIVLSKIDTTANVRGYSVAVTTAGPGGAIEVLLRNVNASNQMAVRTTSSFNDDSWHHVVFTWDGTSSQSASNATIYVDGVSQTLTTVSDTLTATISNTASFRIGARDLADIFFEGMISDVAVYDIELSPTEVSDIYNDGIPTDNTLLETEPNLVGYWFCGEAANDGTMTNMVAGDIINEGAIAAYPSTQIDVSDLEDVVDDQKLGIIGVSSTDDPPTTPVGGEGFGTGDGSAVVISYLMRAIDSNFGGPGVFYHYWLTTGAPDTDASETTAPFGGPLIDIVVAGTYTS